LKKNCPGFAAMRTMVLSFQGILQNGTVKTLHDWLERATTSGLHSLKQFARTLRQDQPAVEAAILLEWSNGPVEGHVNRLKTIKRQMYGRAGIDLLRARLIPIPAQMI
jgi:transposase